MSKKMKFTVEEGKNLLYPTKKSYKVVSNDILQGYIRFISSWKRYAFYPNAQTVLDTAEMLEVVAFIEKLNGKNVLSDKVS